MVHTMYHGIPCTPYTPYTPYGEGEGVPWGGEGVYPLPMGWDGVWYLDPS